MATINKYTLENAIVDFMKKVDGGNENAVIVKNASGYWVENNRSGVGVAATKLVYSYGAFVNSSANWDKDEIYQRIRNAK